MRDSPRPRLRPYPVLRNTEALGDFVDGQQAGHMTQADGCDVRAIEFELIEN
jgi:hypothetical protein